MIDDTSSRASSRFSVIIPVLNETGTINAVIEHLHRLTTGGHFEIEIIVVDGSQEKDTINAISCPDVVTLGSRQGRACQMNAGARLAKSDVLIFLHADGSLPGNAFSAIEGVLDQERYVGGAFSLGIDSKRPLLKLITYLTTLRSRLTRIPYGDQGIFIRRGIFEELGGYRDIPLMEDLEFMRRLRKGGHRICILPDRLMTSPRRWEKEGAFFCTLRNWWIRAGYLCGMSPRRLARFYRQDYKNEGEAQHRER